jgi:hypothetical protein
MRKTSGDEVVRELQSAEAYEELDSSEPARSEIERHAYQIYLDRNGAPGDPVADWLQAEAELRARRAAAAQHD